MFGYGLPIEIIAKYVKMSVNWVQSVIDDADAPIMS